MKYIINMKQDLDKMKNHKLDCPKFPLETDEIMRWEAIIGRDIPMEEIQESKLYVRYNTKENKIKGIYGCLMSHLTLLESIVDLKIDDACILEDDSESDFIIPEELKQSNHITYLGGWLVNRKMKDIRKPVLEKASLKKGINELKESRVLTTRAYYIPRWQLAKDLLSYIHKKKTWKAIDIMMSEYVTHLYYPALSHQILGFESSIGNLQPKIKYKEY